VALRRAHRHALLALAILAVPAGSADAAPRALKAARPQLLRTVGPFEDATVRVRLAGGKRCRRARVAALVDGRAVALRGIGRRWRTRRVAVGGRRSFGLRLRARRGCRLLIGRLDVRPVAHEASAPAPPVPPAAAPSAPPPPPAREAPIVLGAAANWREVATRHGYEELFVANFASMTPENEMKMEALQPKRGQFEFKTADAMVEWALAHGKQVHGHTLVFKSQNPGWLTEASGVEKLTGEGAPFDRDELLGIMRDHVTRVMQHYAGRVVRWDVVNEAIQADGSYVPSVWHETIGPEYVTEAYRAARAAVPDATLCYNEIGAEVPGAVADAVYELVAGLKAEGLIDCVGFQMHVNAATPPAREAVRQNLERFAGLGVELHVSEMDVDVSKVDPASRFAEQARIFGDVALACHAVPACTRFTTWGITDAATWLGPDAQPLPFDTALAPKPAWDAIQGGLRGGQTP
jgi:endo-1,4-beta-xylanase